MVFSRLEILAIERFIREHNHVKSFASKYSIDLFLKNYCHPKVVLRGGYSTIMECFIETLKHSSSENQLQILKGLISEFGITNIEKENLVIYRLLTKLA